MARLESIGAIKEFVEAAPAPKAHGEVWEQSLREWLGTAGVELGEIEEGQDHTLIVWVPDESGEPEVYAIPDAEITAEMRTALELVHEAYFEIYFDADLSPEQWYGALWLLAFTQSPEDFADLMEEMREELDQDEADIDWESLEESDPWLPLEEGEDLPGPITHCYWARLAM